MTITTRLREYMTGRGWITEADNDAAARKALGRKLLKGKITVKQIAELIAPEEDTGPRHEPAPAWRGRLRLRCDRHRFRS